MSDVAQVGSQREDTYHPVNLVCQVNMQCLEVVETRLHTLEIGDRRKTLKTLDGVDVVVLLKVRQSPPTYGISQRLECGKKE